jgi:multiple sugar transport system permease protein
MTNPQTKPAQTPNGRPTAAPALRASSGMRLPISRYWTLLGLALVGIGFLLPFLWMVSTSLKTLPETGQFPPTLLPENPQFANYYRVFVHGKFDFFLAARNTLVIAVLSVLGTTLSSALVAYGFARLRFKGRGVLFALMLGTMMIPFSVVMVSLF